jgi:hypothetical protein
LQLLTFGCFLEVQMRRFAWVVDQICKADRAPWALFRAARASSESRCRGSQDLAEAQAGIGPAEKSNEETMRGVAEMQAGVAELKQKLNAAKSDQGK